MSRLEISGYVQMVVGFVGIIVTVMTAPALLDAIGQVTAGGGMPSEFDTVSGFIRVFAVLVVLLTMLFLVLLGLSITLSTLTAALGAQHPLLCSSAAVGSLFSFAVTGTLAVFSIIFWVPGFVGSLGLLFLAIAGATDNQDQESSGFVVMLFLVLFLVTGLGTLFVWGIETAGSAAT